MAKGNDSRRPSGAQICIVRVLVVFWQARTNAMRAYSLVGAQCNEARVTLGRRDRCKCRGVDRNRLDEIKEAFDLLVTDVSREIDSKELIMAMSDLDFAPKEQIQRRISACLALGGEGSGTVAMRCS